ncbi:MAG: LLM class flavin-dependent oxidoreductase, partial [Candidatus Rokuibacteriota bacterium]
MGFGSGRSLGAALLGEDAPAHVAERARAAERAGLDRLWFIEDYFQTSAFALAGAAAAVTTRIGLGLGVVNPYTRHPALLAMETATLAGIAPGRVVLGLGTGVRRWIADQMAIPAPRPLATLGECVEVLRRLWAGERVSHDGSAFSLHDVALAFKPAQAELPIVLGVKGPRALALAGAVADGVVCSIMSSPAHVRRARET